MPLRKRKALVSAGPDRRDLGTMRFAEYYGNILKTTRRSAPTAQEAQRDYRNLLSVRYSIF